MRVIDAHLQWRGPTGRVLLVTDPPPGAPLANPCAEAVLQRYPASVVAAAGRGTLAEDLARLTGAAHLASVRARRGLISLRSPSITGSLRLFCTADFSA